MVPPCSHRVSRVRRYSGYRWLPRPFAYRTLTFFGWPSHVIQLDLDNTVLCPNPESITTLGLASSAFARHYLRNLCWFLFLALLRCFSSGGSPHTPMYSTHDDKTFLLPDCSIRKSTDISLTYSSPWLIAVSHVLHRLSVPRHSPCAPCSLTILLFGVELIHLFDELLFSGDSIHLRLTLRRCALSLRSPDDFSLNVLALRLWDIFGSFVK